MNIDISECALCLDCRECQHYFECDLPSHDNDDIEKENNDEGMESNS